MKSQLFIFITGVLSGMLLLLVFAVCLVIKAPSLLIVDDKPHKADIAVVLGGGAGSRFQAGLSLYDAGLVKRLLLVDIKKSAWTHILELFCSNCEAEGKDVVILEGSKNTFTDAELVEQYCSKYGINSILVVTAPYHTRRASIVFNAQFAESKVKVSIISSKVYRNQFTPDEKWWQDDSTLKVILSEISKIAIIFLREHEFFTN